MNTQLNRRADIYALFTNCIHCQCLCLSHMLLYMNASNRCRILLMSCTVRALLIDDVGINGVNQYSIDLQRESSMPLLLVEGEGHCQCFGFCSRTVHSVNICCSWGHVNSNTEDPRTNINKWVICKIQPRSI